MARRSSGHQPRRRNGQFGSKGGGGRPGGGRGWRTHNEDDGLAGTVKDRAVDVGRRAEQAADRTAQTAARKGLRRFARWLKRERIW
jgi:hypothetical protein